MRTAKSAIRSGSLKLHEELGELPQVYLMKTRQGRQKGLTDAQISSETMWQLVSAIPGAVIVESWWFRSGLGRMVCECRSTWDVAND